MLDATVNVAGVPLKMPRAALSDLAPGILTVRSYQAKFQRTGPSPTDRLKIVPQ
jgi:hypothetical protein